MNVLKLRRLGTAAALAAALSAAVPAAMAAGGAPNLQINTPAITSIRASLKARFHEQLLPYFNSGVLGVTRDGQIAIRDASDVPLDQRANLASQVAEENREWLNLYGEIARANGHPEWQQDIRRTFAQRFQQKAHAGWYYQNAAGKWERR